MAKRSKGANSNSLSSIVDRIQTKFPNFLLGITILILIAVLGSLLFKEDETKMSPAKKIAEFITGQKEGKDGDQNIRTYTVKEGDYLWMIAEEAYGSGFNAYDIATANKIDNPDIIQPGQKLTLPKVEARAPTRGDLTPAGSTETAVVQTKTYVVKEGDYLWRIAETAYGDGMMWGAIASANNIANPDLIYPGTTLALPGK